MYTVDCHAYQFKLLQVPKRARRTSGQANDIIITTRKAYTSFREGWNGKGGGTWCELAQSLGASTRPPHGGVSCFLTCFGHLSFPNTQFFTVSTKEAQFSPFHSIFSNDHHFLGEKRVIIIVFAAKVLLEGGVT